MNTVFKERRPRIYVVGGSFNYMRPFAPFANIAESVEEADALLFTGGEDVSPELYNEQNYGHSGCNKNRDTREVEIFQKGLEKGLPLLGICRGAQFLTVMAGGKLYQDVSGHAGTHPVVTDDGRTLQMTSTHHQMMRPRGEYVIKAWATHRSRHYIVGKDNIKPELEVDPEIVFYPKIRALCIQGHPEYLDPNHETAVYCRDLVKNLLLKEFA